MNDQPESPKVEPWGMPSESENPAQTHQPQTVTPSHQPQHSAPVTESVTHAQPPNESVLARPATEPQPTDLPVPVVQVLSVRGVEYTMMTLLLWFVAGALLWVAIALINGINGYDAMALPVAMLLVCTPLFAWLFLRLRKAELLQPSLRFDASKRRLSQFTQVITFATCLFNVIGFVYLLMMSVAGKGGSLTKPFLSLAVVLAVAGGILAYYWVDEHKFKQR